ncbi:MAG: 4-hydroxythreonine-4-phosphate dehydrogenase PdxA [Gammaproteobacteria bacterium]|nr:4-hydroxythreonine-4-phosphate dehydrogenase PdxA [Gammaproteobacteria bacterium]
MTSNTLRIALTPGEPAGIGPDLCLLLAQQHQAVELVVICDPELLQQRAAALGLSFRPRMFDNRTSPRESAAGEICILPVASGTPAQCGVLDKRNAHYVLETLDHAIEGCQSSTFDALVTGPVHKGIINDAGIAFSGHTEYLAHATGTKTVVMLLATDELRVALVTTHVPLREVSALITPDRLQRVIRVLHTGLQQHFGMAQPHIKVCGLNPHAGEGGHLGCEEADTIIPTLQGLRDEGIDLDGPLPADTVFNTGYIADSDAILAMYHDQGLPVLKHSGFGRAVNITLGLPIIRTSVDHGTALDLAGTGQANTGSLQTAIKYAANMVMQSSHGTLSS